ncbi:hypothetical protein BDY21DRAFT_91116 [Lineolata rhizophorae]|uniref:Uncharacterized protein n=1 Tax=Lineolata rhizophorae TaxID=578093 RepID=A0A6A6PCN1_9PEZI|nr:hypothetical protein BDY21DRAFT_91116 [Lineolata rhizophorae]
MRQALKSCHGTDLFQVRHLATLPAGGSRSHARAGRRRGRKKKRVEWNGAPEPWYVPSCVLSVPSLPARPSSDAVAGESALPESRDMSRALRAPAAGQLLSPTRPGARTQGCTWLVCTGRTSRRLWSPSEEICVDGPGPRAAVLQRHGRTSSSLQSALLRQEDERPRPFARSRSLARGKCPSRAQ